jgi:hypothetical protein
MVEFRRLDVVYLIELLAVAAFSRFWVLLSEADNPFSASQKPHIHRARKKAL